MRKSPNPKKRSRASDTWDLLLAILLFLLALGVRLLYARAVAFPHSDEAAFYLTTAENLVAGRGLEVDVLWSYQVPFPAVTHPSHERWMPMTTGLIAAALIIQEALPDTLETSLQTGQLPGLILGALLASLTYLIGRRSLPGDGATGFNIRSGSRWVSLSAALLVVLSSTLSHQSASVDSSAPFVLLVAWALALAVRRPHEQGGYLGVGFLIALAYLTHTSGLLLLLAIPLAWYLLPAPHRPVTVVPDSPAAELVWQHWPRDRGMEEETQRSLGPSLRNILDLGIAFAIVAVPWLVRNYLAFGTPQPTPVLSDAWLANYADHFNYWQPPTWKTWLTQSWSTLLDQRVQALMYNGRVLLLTTLPWGLLALPGLWLLRREWSFFSSIIYSLLLFFGLVLVFPVSSMSGAFYHSLGTVMPFLALATMYTIQRAMRLLGQRRTLARSIAAVAVVVLLALAGAQVVESLPNVTERNRADKEQFEAVADWLAQHAAPDEVVMGTRTYALNYASGHPSIALPGNEPPGAAWEAAQRNGARYLVVTQPFGQYPQILRDSPDLRFRLVEEIQGTSIYQIEGSQP